MAAALGCIGQNNYRWEQIDENCISALIAIFSEGNEIENPQILEEFIKKAGTNKAIQAIESMDQSGHLEVEIFLFNFFSKRCPGIQRGEGLSQAEKAFNKQAMSKFFATNSLQRVVEELVEEFRSATKQPEHDYKTSS